MRGKDGMHCAFIARSMTMVSCHNISDHCTRRTALKARGEPDARPRRNSYQVLPRWGMLGTFELWRLRRYY
eukprot:1586989-Rhodomonas_salina.2